MGRHMKRLLKFAIDYPGWHTMSRFDRPARNAMNRLERMGLLEVVWHANKTIQFRLRQPKGN